MPAPATVDEFVDLIRRSAVLDEPRLSSYVQKLKTDPATPKDLSAVAGLFVRDGLLTYFQAEQFLQGRWKRFTIGKYKVLEKLGSGGMGQVFLCEHKLMRRRVAVKVLPTAKAADPSSLERFYREARAVAALDHPNIVRAYDIDQDDNLHFLVMEYVDGSSLQDMIRKAGKMDVTRACHYVYWSAIGLQHAHAAGLIHRDIKPGNILVDRQGVVKILDLGLARFFNDDQDLLTKKYDESVLGTADYLAPEQAIDSHTVDGRADIYSLGATFYFLLTGGPPFAEGSVAQKLLWHQTRKPKSVREVRPEVPEAVAAVIEKMMSKKPEERHATPTELADALLPFTQTAIPPPPDEEMPQLSAAAQGSERGPSQITSGPKTIVQAPRTPMPTHGGTRPPAADGRTSTPAGVRPLPSTGGTAVADADTQRSQPIPVVEPIPDSSPGGVPIWEAISAETANASRTDTDKRKRDESSRRTKAKPVEKPTSKARVAPKSEHKQVKPPPPRLSSLGLILTITGGLVLILGGAAAAYWFGFRDKSKPTRPENVAEPRTLFLTKHTGGAPLHFTSLQKAIEEFRPGDTIVIKDDEWEEFGAATRTKNLVITAPEGKRVIWRAPANKKAGALLSLANTDGTRIAGISFQGNGQVRNLVYLSLANPGLVLEDVELLDAEAAALALHDCVGQASRPVTIRRARFANPGGKECKSAVVFSADTVRPNAPPVGSQHVHFVSCLAEGPVSAGAFQFEGSATGIDIRHCRVFKAGNGVLFRKLTAPTQAIWQVTIFGNTFHTLTGAAIRCEDVNQVKARAENRLAINQNFFAGVAAVGQMDGGNLTNAKFLHADANSNARKTGTNPGVGIPTSEVNADVATDAANRAQFLLYDRNSPLFKAANGKPVGAPPE